MKRTKIVFIIPGFRQKISQKGYLAIRKRLKAEKYIVAPIAVPWQGSTILENTKFFLEKYKRSVKKYPNNMCDIYLLGFSYGALIAFVAATKVKVTGLILCSLSPFFKEDLPKKLPETISSLQEKRHYAFATLSVSQLAKKIKAKNIIMLYGEKESASLIKRTKSAFAKISSKKKYLFAIKNTDHTISRNTYISAIHFACSFL